MIGRRRRRASRLPSALVETAHADQTPASPEPTHWVLSLSCPDRPGIVHAVAGLLAEHGGNITESQQFGDQKSDLFFMRVQVETAAALLEILRPRGIPLIINDRVDVALAVGADGVHVGQSDIPAAMVRKMIGPDKILGLSVSYASELTAPDLAVVDYIGVGPIYATATKTNAAPPIGFEGLAALAAASPVPVTNSGAPQSPQKYCSRFRPLSPVLT